MTMTTSHKLQAVNGSQTGERGLAGDVYYLVIANLPGISGTSSGVYALIIEERP